MANTMIDIFNNLLKYNKKQIIVIIDNNDVPWFSAIDVAEILGYVETDKAIRMHVRTIDKEKFINLKQYMKIIPSNMQPHAIFINESGLYSLIFESKKPFAETFRNWVTAEVLPSIRKTGYYRIEEKYQKQINSLNVKLQEVKKENRILKHNQKRKKYNKTGMVYVIRNINSTKNLYKIGKTMNFNKRLNVYNTSVPDNMEVLFTLEVNDPEAVELCMKALLKKNIYRNNKEYYKSSLVKIKEVISKCDKLVQGSYFCESCQTRITNFDHFIEKHHTDDNEKLLVGLAIRETKDYPLLKERKQHGGNDYNGINNPPKCENMLFHRGRRLIIY